ncbi:pyrimidine-specific ribonucleoside hydrolase RihB-like [Ptychodera flava]|uniref:pyrimidine-specific ribonucleoside hydrolase RihB-like n=1 Tax=Ptychodera flava TaxID=63121 RepID=UPI00396AA45C
MSFRFTAHASNVRAVSSSFGFSQHVEYSAITMSCQQKSSEDRIRMLIDCDAGRDDAEAIAMALTQPNVEVVGITCVNGNTDVDNVCRNVLRLLKVYEREEIPVFKGCETSLLDIDKGKGIDHGDDDGFGNVHDYITPDMSLLKSEHAVNAIVRLADQYQGELSLLCIGPMTNIALAMRMDSELPKKLRDVTIMGGSLDGVGNTTVCGEFNFAVDPEAANIVLNSITQPATVLTYDVCEKHSLSKAWFDERLQIGTEKAKFISAICGTPVDDPYISWDGLAIIARLRSDAVLEKESQYATVELGCGLSRAQMIIDRRGKLEKPANVNLVKKLKMDIVKHMLIESVK